MSTTAVEPTTSPGHELAACARYVTELLNRLADSAESNQPEAVGYWMRQVREIQASARDELMAAAVAVERAAGASWTAIGAAQDPPVSRQAAQQRYRRLARRTDVNSDVDVVAEPRPEPTRQTETSVTDINKHVDDSPRGPTRRQPASPRKAVSAGGKWAADDRRDLIRADDYQTSGVWLVTVDGVTVGSVQPKYSSARTKRWTALINGMPILDGRSFPSRDKAAIQLLLEHNYMEERVRNRRRRHLKPHRTQ